MDYFKALRLLRRVIDNSTSLKWSRLLLFLNILI